MTTQIKATDDQVSSWKKTFDMLDTDNSGFIDRHELKAGLIALEQPNSDEDINHLLKSEGLFMNGGTVSIDKDTFLRIIGAYAVNELTQEDVLDIFATIDIDASGYLTAAELQHFLANLPGSNFLSDDKMSQLLQMYDDDGNGKITLDEFQRIIIDLGYMVKANPASTNSESQPNLNTMKAAVSKAISLSSIENEDLRNALAGFDAEGNGIIDLKTVQEAAEGKNHWSDNRRKVGLADHIQSLNHVAILVSDVSRSLEFYKNVMGFEQIRRPNFDKFGAWLTMGQVELHLIKGNPVVHSGDNLVVGHFSFDAINMVGAISKLKSMNINFRVNSSVPAGADAGTANTNSNNDMMSEAITTQIFLRDPDGYYLEICNCDKTLTKYCLGKKADLPGFREGVRPLSLSTASVTINLMQRWIDKLKEEDSAMEEMFELVMHTDGSIKEVAYLLDCEAAEAVDKDVLQTLIDRHSVYSDLWQNEEESAIQEILLEAGNDPKQAEKIVKLREKHRGKTIYRPPVVFKADGTKYLPTPIVKARSVQYPRLSWYALSA